jgi:hypothetical protein
MQTNLTASVVCHCTKLPHIHYNGYEGYTVVTKHKVIQVASYEEGRALMQTISGIAVLYYHQKPINGIVSERGNLMHLSNNPPTAEEVYAKAVGQYLGYYTFSKPDKYVFKAKRGYVVVNAKAEPIAAFKNTIQFFRYWKYAN